MRSSKLYVGNLSYSATEEDLGKLFSEFGTVVGARIIGGRGFGFVEMSSPIEAEEAIETFNGYKFMGRIIRVAKAQPPKKRDGKQGGKPAKRKG